jgi:hypothetical protein
VSAPNAFGVHSRNAGEEPRPGLQTPYKSTLNSRLICAIGLALLAFLLTPRVRAQDAVANPKPSVEDLAKLKQDPLSGLRTVIFQTEVSPNVPGSGKTEGSYSIQPVWPFSLGPNWKVITYTILPILQLPVPGEDTNVGLGDTLINLYVAPKKPGPIVWGAGPAILLPTRTDSALGPNTVSLGPSAVLFYAKGQASAGVVLQNIWSLGGSGANEVNLFGAQYFITYNLPKGWFLYSNATITANWLADSDDRWTVPIGGGLGRIFNIGQQSVSLSAQGFYNVVRPHNGPETTAIVQFAFLFP